MRILVYYDNPDTLIHELRMITTDIREANKLCTVMVKRGEGRYTTAVLEDDTGYRIPLPLPRSEVPWDLTTRSTGLMPILQGNSTVEKV